MAFIANNMIIVGACYYLTLFNVGVSVNCSDDDITKCTQCAIDVYGELEEMMEELSSCQFNCRLVNHVGKIHVHVSISLITFEGNIIITCSLSQQCHFTPCTCTLISWW